MGRTIRLTYRHVAGVQNLRAWSLLCDPFLSANSECCI